MTSLADVAVVIRPGLVVVGLVSLVFAIFIIVDMARRPAWQWQRAGSNKALWLVLEILLLVLLGFLSIIVGVLYLAIVRPKLVAVERQGQGPPGGYPGSGYPGSGYPGGYPTGGAYPGAGGPWGWPTGAPPSSAPPMPGAGGPPPYPAAQPEPYQGTQPHPGTQPYPGTQAEPSAPPFGWYPDPSGAHELRYWDGVSWTEHVSDGGTQSTDPLPH